MPKTPRKSTIGNNPLDQLGRIKGKGRRPSVHVDPETRADISAILGKPGRSAPAHRGGRKSAGGSFAGWVKSVWRGLKG